MWVSLSALNDQCLPLFQVLPSHVLPITQFHTLDCCGEWYYILSFTWIPLSHSFDSTYHLQPTFRHSILYAPDTAAAFTRSPMFLIPRFFISLPYLRLPLELVTSCSINHKSVLRKREKICCKSSKYKQVMVESEYCTIHNIQHRTFMELWTSGTVMIWSVSCEVMKAFLFHRFRECQSEIPYELCWVIHPYQITASLEIIGDISP